MRPYPRHSAPTRNLLIWLGIFVVAAAVGVFRQRPETVVLHGPFHVVDGDTLTNESGRLRLRGMDAPEMKQTCGEGSALWSCGLSARQEMQRLVGADTTCTGEGRDKYRRLLVRCTRAGKDIGAEMVRPGQALAYGGYEREEAEARAARRGLWAGPFERPADWRKANRLLSPSEEREEDQEIPSPKVHWSLGLAGDSLFGK